MEFHFDITGINGEAIEVTMDDVHLRYCDLRKNLPESVCIEMIEQIKKSSGKKCVLLYGNCQTIFLVRMLLRHIHFSRDFFLIEVPAVHLLDETDFDLIFGEGQLFQLIDLFIAQQVKESEFRVAPPSATITKLLKFGTKIVWIPNIYFDGYFPQVAKKRIPKIEGKILSEQFPYPDHFVDKIMFESKMNPDVEKILDQISTPDFLSRKEIQLGIDESLAELKNREWICDVKISDYIEDNFLDKQIFYTTNHPFAFVMFELVRRILRFVGFRSDNFLQRSDLINEQHLMFSIIGFNIPLYPQVQKFFDFKECESMYWANMGLSQFRGDFRDFMREYIKQCWAEKFTNQS